MGMEEGGRTASKGAFISGYFALQKQIPAASKGWKL